MARSLVPDRATGGYTYTQDQVWERLHDPAAKISLRYDLLDEHRLKIGELNTVSRESGDAVVEHNIDQAVMGSLTVKMAPDERLRNVPYRRYIKPWWGLQMRNGGWAEWPYGVYVWTIPSKELVAKGVEDWQLVLPDQTDILNTQGPAGSFAAFTGGLITDAILDILGQVGIADTSGVEESDATFDQERWWILTQNRPITEDWSFRRIPSTLRSPSGLAGIWLRLMENPEGWQANNDVIAAQGFTSWLTILTELHASLGYWPPHFDWNGRYIARSALDARDLRPSRYLRYVTDEKSISRDIKTQMELGKFANNVVVDAQNPDGLFAQAWVSADDWIPDHPLTFQNCGRYTISYSQDSNATTSDQLEQHAIVKLFEMLNITDRAQWVGHCNPAHEPFDFWTLHVPDHPELRRPSLYRGHMISLDLNSPDMEHGGYKAWVNENLYGLIGQDE